MVSIIGRGLEQEVVEVAATAFNAGAVMLDQSIGAGISEDLSLGSILISDNWATGTAGIGADITIRLGVEFEDGFSADIAQELSEAATSYIEQGGSNVPERLDSTVGDIDFIVVDQARAIEGVTLTLNRGTSTQGVVVDVLNNVVFSLDDEGEVQTQTIEEFADRGTDEIPPAQFEELEDVEPAMQLFEQVEEEIEEQVERDEFPGIPDPFKPYATSDNNVEVKAGKETKSLEPREPYDFEVRMGLTANQIRNFNLNNDRNVTPRPISNCVGISIDLGSFGSRDPPANFPNTLEYIRQHLLNEGPSYALEVFNDLVLYGGFISQAHAESPDEPINLYASSYENIRNVFGRIEKVQEEGLAPELIRAIPPAEAQELGLDTMPKLPLNGGGEIDAPWLESRQYYEIVEENSDDDAWQNINSLLYERSAP